ncbi:MAG: alpha/beta hydrolase [Bacilli bacterium]
MIHEIIHLNQYYPLPYDPILEINLAYYEDGDFRKPTPGIIIVPGGGYEFVARREADSVALKFMEKKYSTFILYYSVKQAYPVPQKELLAAFDFVKHNCQKYSTLANKISLIGFSAGGHLVGSYSYLCQRKEFLDLLPHKEKNCCPNSIILSYPVITMGKNTERQTRFNITGGDSKLDDLLSIEKNITPSYPPTFYWATITDNCVPIDNGYLLKKALDDNHVRNECLFYPFLDHGVSIGTDMVNKISPKDEESYKEVAGWFEKAIEFIKCF